MSELRVGDKVTAKMQHGYAPITGEIVDIWVNEYGVRMADIAYAGNHHILRALKSLKRA